MQSEIDSFLAQNNERLVNFFTTANENLKIISMKADTASSKMGVKDLDEAIASTSTFKKENLQDMNEQGVVNYVWESAASFTRGDFGSAITSADMAIGRQQSPFTASFVKGMALRKLNRLEEAISAFNSATEMGPTGDPIVRGAWIGKAGALRKLGRLEEALFAYERAIEIDPNNYAAWTGKAATLGGLKRYEEYLSASARAKELEPNNDSKT
jgi:tetratricopeptide (TPR) repeat protein